MRPVQSLELENFRGFAGKHAINLDADLVLISGKNGVGKTSILLALDLLLNGQTKLLQQVGPMLTEGTTSGRLAIVGGGASSVDLALAMRPALYGDLLERAHFFFPDAMDAPESAMDVVSILEPQAGAWVEIRNALEVAQRQVAFRKDEVSAQASSVERSRRAAAQQFEKALEEVDANALGLGSNFGDGQSLLLSGGNLSNHWQSQLRNLLAKLESIAKVGPSSADGVDQTLESIAMAVRALRDDLAAQSEAHEDTRLETLSTLAGHLSAVDPERAFIWAQQPGEDFTVSHDRPVAFPDSDKSDEDWVARIAAVKKAMEGLANQDRELKATRRLLTGSDESLAAVLGQIAEHGALWLERLDPVFSKGGDASLSIRAWLEWGIKRKSEFSHGLEGMLGMLDNQASECKEEEVRLARELKELQEIYAAGRLLRRFREESWVRSSQSVGELVDYVRQTMSASGRQVSARRAGISQLGTLEFAASNWANTERAIQADTHRARGNGVSERPDSVFSEAEKTLKRALARDGIFSLATEINDRQFRELLVTLNRLLARFHFPADFLPIRLETIPGRGKAPSIYRFVSRANVEYKGLSTGQKTQLAMCWTVCLSYALREKLTARIIGFDDFTTALDMGQLIPAAGILRQLAYGTAGEYRRQVIVTSHHEDLTNRLVDYLLPPPGCTMKVVEIDEWTINEGPTWKVYNAKMSRNAGMPDRGELGRWLRTQMHTRMT